MLSCQARICGVGSEVAVTVQVQLPASLTGYPLRQLQPLLLGPNLGPVLAQPCVDGHVRCQLYLVRADQSLHFYLGRSRQPSRRLARLQAGNHMPLALVACSPLSYRLTKELLTTTEAQPGWFELSSEEELQTMLELIWRFKYKPRLKKKQSLDGRMRRANRGRRLDIVRRLAARAEPRPSWYEALVQTGDPGYVLEVFSLLRLEQTRSSKMSVGKALRLEAALKADLQFLVEAATRAHQPQVVAALVERHRAF